MLVSRTVGKTDTWETSGGVGMEGTGITWDTGATVGAISTFLLCC